MNEQNYKFLWRDFYRYQGTLHGKEATHLQRRPDCTYPCSYEPDALFPLDISK